jgi:hypothetical protein
VLDRDLTAASAAQHHGRGPNQREQFLDRVGRALFLPVADDPSMPSPSTTDNKAAASSSALIGLAN